MSFCAWPTGADSPSDPARRSGGPGHRGLIGAAAAAALAQEGAHVIRVARSLTESTAAGTEDIPCDLTDPGQVSRLGSRVIGQHGPPEIVVSNAGAFLLRTLEATDAADLETQLAVNIRAPFYLARAFLPAMRKAGRGSFISVGSVACMRRCWQSTVEPGSG